MQIGQVARIVSFPLALLLSHRDHRSRVLAAIGSGDHLLLGLALEHDLDRVVGVDAAQLRVVAQHFSSNLLSNAILSRRSLLAGGDGLVPLGTLRSFLALRLRDA